MKTISRDFAAGLIDFAPESAGLSPGFARAQLDGAVASYNMLARNGVAYIADEVGLGKTYVALGVLGLMRHNNPRARAMIIAPRENIQRKWVKELSNFIRVNWQVEDNRFKNLQGGPVRPPIVCDRLGELAAAVMRHEDCDPVLRMTTFSVAVKDSERRKKYVREIRRYAPWLAEGLTRVRRPDEFITRLGFAINGLLPKLDLLIIDEAHNLRHGFGPGVSNRNRLLAVALGHEDPGITPPEWYEPKAKRVLMLSATPFECDYADIHGQLHVLGKSKARLSLNGTRDSVSVGDLLDKAMEPEQHKGIVRRMMLRRVGHMNIAGTPHSKNMYRREWRSGGYLDHDQPMRLTDERQRLVVALIQKKVTELLGDERFKNCFQIGMLSSFESFLESIGRRANRARLNEDDDEEGAELAFDLAEQTEDAGERRGIDTGHVEAIASSYRERFGESLPHPKLDATCNALADAFDTGEKALVFVRRVATVGELKAKLDRRFDKWLRERMHAALPALTGEIDQLFDRYHAEQRRRGVGEDAEFSQPEAPEEGKDELRPGVVDDTGGIDTFFAWFFRGEGPQDVLSGASLQRNRFASTSSTYSTFFEDDLVAWLLGNPDDPKRTLADALGMDEPSLDRRLRRRAFGYYEQRTRQKSGYPRFYVYESYHAAALSLLAEKSDDLAEHAAIVLDERFDGWSPNEAEPPDGFPQSHTGIGIRTLITELQRRPELRAEIWPDDALGAAFRERFRRREQRRELLSAMCCLGATYIDLYLAAIGLFGSLAPGRQEDAEVTPGQLAGHFLDLLEQQRPGSSFGAYRELSSAAAAFDTIVAVNFPGLPNARLSALPAMFAGVLQHQVPVAGVAGGVNKRVVQQFRMPGFPLVLASTDVLQEGEDLHTFCRRVIHYGIAWTPSAVEQRTGRVDRIGSLAQRVLEADGRAQPPASDEFIQVYYPHLIDTIEVLQVRRVLERINEFLRLSHRDVSVARTYDSRLNMSVEMLRDLKPVPRITDLLQSAFDDTASWLDGDIGPDAIRRPPIDRLESKLEAIWEGLRAELHLERERRPSRRAYRATAFVTDRSLLRAGSPPPPDVRRQPFTLTLRSQVSGDETLIRCESPVGRLDLEDDDVLADLYDLEAELGHARICARQEARGNQFMVSIEEERLFHLSATQPSEVRQLIEKTVVAADVIEQELLAVDAEVHASAEESE